MAEWESIKKGEGGNGGYDQIPATTVKCTDVEAEI